MVQYGGIQTQYASALIESDLEARKELSRVSSSFAFTDSFEAMLPASMLALARRVHFNYSTPGGLSASDPTEDKGRFSNLRVQRFAKSDYQVWTDGSVDLDKASGGAALVYDKTQLCCKVMCVSGNHACS